MPEQGNPSVRRRRLAAELRRLRERAGITGDKASERLGWSGSKLSRIENNKIGVKQEDLRLLLDLYRVGETHRSEVLALARESAEVAPAEDAAVASYPAPSLSSSMRKLRQSGSGPGSRKLCLASSKRKAMPEKLYVAGTKCLDCRPPTLSFVLMPG